ncbi:MAG: protoporphyrinogen oxidase-related protein [Herbaspirillum sp.]|nr:protoporphyrinogen oxidase-related protein [Herbaspirillum sp.]
MCLLGAIGISLVKPCEPIQMGDQSEQRSGIYDVIIVGGGISGVSFAYECQKADIHHLLLEAKSRLGGCIQTFDNVDRGIKEVELGAHTLYNSYAHCIALIEEFGLQIKPLRNRKILIRSAMDGQSYSLLKKFDFSAFFCAMTVYLCKKLATQQQYPTLLRKLTAMLGEKNASTVVHPMLRALYNQEIDTVPTDIFLRKKKRQRNKSYPKKFGLQGGIEQLIRKMSERIQYRLNQDVFNIQKDGHFLIHTPEQIYQCKQLVLALPAKATAQFSEIIDAQSDDDLDVSFCTSVISSAPHTGPFIMAFESKDLFSRLKQFTADCHEVCHHRQGINVAGSIFDKLQHLPNLSNLHRLAGKTSGLYLIGNYFSGMAVEDCIQYAKKSFDEFYRSVKSVSLPK